jgi:hypothetical protein
VAFTMTLIQVTFQMHSKISKMFQITNIALSLRWIISELDFNTLKVEYLAFQCVGHTFYVIYLDHIIGRLGCVIRNIYNNIMEEVKQLCARMSFLN